jgi:hypothetical protein
MDANEISRSIIEADRVNEMMLHPGMKIVLEHMKEYHKRAYGQWLMAKPEEAEAIRQHIKGEKAFFKYISEIRSKGQIAARRSNTPPSANTEQGE